MKVCFVSFLQLYGTTRHRFSHLLWFTRYFLMCCCARFISGISTSDWNWFETGLKLYWKTNANISLNYVRRRGYCVNVLSVNDHNSFVASDLFSPLFSHCLTTTCYHYQKRRYCREQIILAHVKPMATKFVGILLVLYRRSTTVSELKQTKRYWCWDLSFSE